MNGTERIKRVAERLSQRVRQMSGHLSSLGIARIEKISDDYICRKCRDVNRSGCPLEETQKKPCCKLSWLETKPEAENAFFKRVYRTCEAYKLKIN